MQKSVFLSAESNMHFILTLSVLADIHVHEGRTCYGYQATHTHSQ